MATIARVEPDQRQDSLSLDYDPKMHLPKAGSETVQPEIKNVLPYGKLALQIAASNSVPDQHLYHFHLSYKPRHVNSPLFLHFDKNLL